MKEIGSEFWTVDLDSKDNQLDFLNIGIDYKLLMSGRTAIDYVLNEIEDNKKIVYMPNYCCSSMLQPFIDNGYKINYYDVDVINNKYNIDINIDCSIFFAMSYFGYDMSNMDDYIESFNKQNVIVIEDITHRFLSKKNYCNSSNYLIGSLRKWFPLISGGIAISLRHKFKTELTDYRVNTDFVELKLKAMNLKRDYINGITSRKEEFLEIFRKSNEMIKDYKNMKIDELSVKILKSLDIDDIRKKRIGNCLLIEKILKNNNKIKLLYTYKNGDCPLFVPIIINERDKIRKELVNDNIYLPSHWPNSSMNNLIYDYELSLINDQRYSESDIKQYIYKLIELGCD